MTVLSFEAWKENGAIIEMDDSCDRPFHVTKYVVNVDGVDKCTRCNIKTNLSSHPSFDGTRWYG